VLVFLKLSLLLWCLPTADRLTAVLLLLFVIVVPDAFSFRLIVSSFS